MVGSRVIIKVLEELHDRDVILRETELISCSLDLGILESKLRN